VAVRERAEAPSGSNVSQASTTSSARARQLPQRREHVRVRVPVSVLGIDGRGNVVGGRTLDISGSGALIQLKRRTDVLEEQGRIELLITLPGRAVVVQARVVGRRGERLYALEFEEIADRDRERLVAFVFGQIRRHTTPVETRERAPSRAPQAKPDSGGLRRLFGWLLT
jgi:c-di-GMP-binding flagellar brake protein YcgR